MLSLKPAIRLLKKRINDPGCNHTEILPVFDFLGARMVPQFLGNFQNLSKVVGLLFSLCSDVCPEVSQRAELLLLESISVLGPYRNDVYFHFILQTVAKKSAQNSCKLSYVRALVRMIRELVIFLRLERVYELIETGHFLASSAVRLEDLSLVRELIVVFKRFDRTLRKLERMAWDQAGREEQYLKLRRSLMLAVNESLHKSNLLRTNFEVASAVAELAVIISGKSKRLCDELLRLPENAVQPGIFIQFLHDYDCGVRIKSDMSFCELQCYKHNPVFQKGVILQYMKKWDVAKVRQVVKDIEKEESKVPQEEVSAYFDLMLELLKNGLVKCVEHREDKNRADSNDKIVVAFTEVEAFVTKGKALTPKLWSNILMFYEYFSLTTFPFKDRMPCYMDSLSAVLADRKKPDRCHINAEVEVRAVDVRQKILWSNDVFDIIYGPTIHYNAGTDDASFDTATIVAVVEMVLTANYNGNIDAIAKVVDMLSRLFQQDVDSIDEKIVNAFVQNAKYFNRGDPSSLFVTMYKNFPADKFSVVFLRLLSAMYYGCDAMNSCFRDYFGRLKGDSEMCILLIPDLPHCLMAMKAMKRISKWLPNPGRSQRKPGSPQNSQEFQKQSTIPYPIVSFIILFLRLIVAVLKDDWNETRGPIEYRQLTDDFGSSGLIRHHQANPFLNLCRRQELLNLRDVISDFLYYWSRHDNISARGQATLSSLAASTACWPSKSNWRLLSQCSEYTLCSVLGEYSSIGSVAYGACWQIVRTDLKTGKLDKSVRQNLENMAKSSPKIHACCQLLNRNVQCLVSRSFVKAFDEMWENENDKLPETLNKFLSEHRNLIPLLRRNLQSDCVHDLLSEDINKLNFTNDDTWNEYGKFLFRVRRYLLRRKPDPSPATDSQDGRKTEVIEQSKDTSPMDSKEGGDANEIIKRLRRYQSNDAKEVPELEALVDQSKIVLSSLHEASEGKWNSMADDQRDALCKRLSLNLQSMNDYVQTILPSGGSVDSDESVALLSRLPSDMQEVFDSVLSRFREMMDSRQFALSSPIYHACYETTSSETDGSHVEFDESVAIDLVVRLSSDMKEGFDSILSRFQEMTYHLQFALSSRIHGSCYETTSSETDGSHADSDEFVAVAFFSRLSSDMKEVFDSILSRFQEMIGSLQFPLSSGVHDVCYETSSSEADGSHVDLEESAESKLLSRLSGAVSEVFDSLLSRFEEMTDSLQFVSSSGMHDACYEATSSEADRSNVDLEESTGSKLLSRLSGAVSEVFDSLLSYFQQMKDAVQFAWSFGMHDACYETTSSGEDRSNVDLEEPAESKLLSRLSCAVREVFDSLLSYFQQMKDAVQFPSSIRSNTSNETAPCEADVPELLHDMLLRFQEMTNSAQRTLTSLANGETKLSQRMTGSFSAGEKRLDSMLSCMQDSVSCVLSWLGSNVPEESSGDKDPPEKPEKGMEDKVSAGSRSPSQNGKSDDEEAENPGMCIQNGFLSNVLLQLLQNMNHLIDRALAPSPKSSASGLKDALPRLSGEVTKMKDCVCRILSLFLRAGADISLCHPKDSVKKQTEVVGSSLPSPICEFMLNALHGLLEYLQGMQSYIQDGLTSTEADPDMKPLMALLEKTIANINHAVSQCRTNSSLKTAGAEEKGELSDADKARLLTLLAQFQEMKDYVGRLRYAKYIIVLRKMKALTESVLSSFQETILGSTTGEWVTNGTDCWGKSVSDVLKTYFQTISTEIGEVLSSRTPQSEGGASSCDADKDGSANSVPSTADLETLRQRVQEMMRNTQHTLSSLLTHLVDQSRREAPNQDARQSATSTVMTPELRLWLELLQLLEMRAWLESVLKEADILAADLADADMPAADLADAKIPAADLADAKIPAADLADAKIPASDLASVRLETVKRLFKILKWAQFHPAAKQGKMTAAQTGQKVDE